MQLAQAAHSQQDSEASATRLIYIMSNLSFVASEVV